MTRRTITTVGHGSAQASPDVAAIAFSAASSAESAKEALDGASQAAEAMSSRVREVADATVSTSQLTLHPDWREGKESGYRAEIGVLVRVPASADVGGLISAVADAGGDSARISSISFSHSKPEELAALARSAAFQQAADKAKQYAKLSRASLGRVISIDERAMGSPTPFPRMMAKGAAADAAMSVPVEAGSLSVDAEVTVCWEIQPKP